jgi:hypothetical protein
LILLSSSLSHLFFRGLFSSLSVSFLSTFFFFFIFPVLFLHFMEAERLGLEAARSGGVDYSSRGVVDGRFGEEPGLAVRGSVDGGVAGEDFVVWVPWWLWVINVGGCD